MNSNSSGWNSCLAVVIGGILFVLWPILITVISIACEQTYIRWSFGIWILVLVITFVSFEDNATKFGIGALECFIYAMIFCSWYSEYELRGDYSDGGLGDLMGMFLGVFTMLVPMYFIGNIIIGKIENQKQKKREQQIILLNKQISECNTDISKMEKAIRDKKSALKTIKLLDICGARTKEVSNNSEFRTIEIMYRDIEMKKHNLEEMHNKLTNM